MGTSVVAYGLYGLAILLLKLITSVCGASDSELKLRSSEGNLVMKTPEQMAEEYCNTKQLSYVERLVITRGYIDGYEAAKDTYKDAINTYEDVAKQMLKEAVRIMSPKDQLADADKVMPQWISVKDRLPENGVEVLVVSDGETGASWHEAGEFGWAIGGTVTHWMPLPEPPEDK